MNRAVAQKKKVSQTDARQSSGVPACTGGVGAQSHEALADRGETPASGTLHAQPRERPILFSAEMVRSLLAGRKTQTRRVIKPQPTTQVIHGSDLEPSCDGDLVTPAERKMYHVQREGEEWFEPLPCPYGAVGDRLWVRETWLPRANGTAAFYRASLAPTEAAGIAGMYSDRGWRSPIHMSRWASRITLELTAVRVERLQDISEEDARAEGVGGDYLRDEYAMLWDELNAERGYSWEGNPWVWVLTFRLVGERP